MEENTKRKIIMGSVIVGLLGIGYVIYKIKELW